MSLALPLQFAPLDTPADIRVLSPHTYPSKWAHALRWGVPLSTTTHKLTSSFSVGPRYGELLIHWVLRVLKYLKYLLPYSETCYYNELYFLWILAGYIQLKCTWLHVLQYCQTAGVINIDTPQHSGLLECRVIAERGDTTRLRVNFVGSHSISWGSD